MVTEPPLTGGLILSGVPGAGKSTVARLLAERFEQSAHIHSDDLLTFFVSGRVRIREEPKVEAERQLQLIGRNVACVASNFASEGFFPVIEFIIARRERLDAFVASCTVRPLLLVTLDPGNLVARERERLRGQEVGKMFPGLEAEIRAELGGIGLWLDNSEQTADATVDEIIRRAASDAVIAPAEVEHTSPSQRDATTDR